jgi:hypothetical protein
MPTQTTIADPSSRRRPRIEPGPSNDPTGSDALNDGPAEAS